jgi:hypothetical protein
MSLSQFCQSKDRRNPVYLYHRDNVLADAVAPAIFKVEGPTPKGKDTVTHSFALRRSGPAVESP